MKKNLSLSWFSSRKTRKKLLLLMRIGYFLIFFTAFQLYAAVPSKSQITLNMNNVSVKEVFDAISAQTEKVFFYSDSQINLSRKVSIDVKDQSIEAILNSILSEYEDFSYEITDQYIIIVPKNEKAVETVVSKKIKIKGTITDESGNPLPGTTVLEEGTLNGVTTDEQGKYTLTVSGKNSVLKISFVGFETQKITVNNKKVINVVLKEVATSLDEVVITGYQDIPEVRSTGSVSKVTAADIKESGAVSIDQVFRGKMAGALALNVSGRPGATTRIRIRGLNSITGNMEPIWIVDGIEMKEAVPNISIGGLNLQNSILTNGIGAIAPEDIESITVLKDAAASALYGARAANGVIVVKTRNGNAGDNRIRISTSFSLSEAPTNHYEMMNTAEKIQYERDLFEDRPLGAGAGRVVTLLRRAHQRLMTEEDAEAQIAELSKIETDWFDVIFRTAYSRRHSINFSGGTQKMQYYASANLSEEQGILEGNKLNSFNSTAKLTFVPIPKLKIETQLRMSVRKDIIPNPYVDPFEYATFANPYEKPYNDDGSYDADETYTGIYNYLTEEYRTDYNILEDMATSTRQNKTSSVTFDGRISYDLLKNLNIESQLQYTNSSSYGREWAEPGSFSSYQRNILINSGMRSIPEDMNKGYLRETHGDSESYTFKNLIKYNVNLNDKHFVNVLLGQEASKTDAGNFFNLLPEYDPLYKIGSYPGELDPRLFEGWYNNEITFDTYNFPMLGNTGISQTRAASFFMTASYSYKDIYVLNGSIRYDGVDIIGNKNNFTPLWNISGKWNIHREKFMENLDFIEVLSLRASVGYTGSIDRNALPFTYLRYVSGSYYDGTLLPNEVNWQNPNIKWQKKYDRNIGFNASLFKSKLNVEFNYYNNRVIDLLDDKQLPFSKGFSSIKTNVASLTNQGFELTVNTAIINNNDWRWTVNFNLSKNENKITDTFIKKVTELPVISRQSAGSMSKYYTVGYDVSAVFGYDFAGVDPLTGNTLIYANNEEYLNEWEIHSEKDGRKIIDMDRYFNHEATVSYLGKREPSISGGFGTTVSYKSFTLAAQFVYVTGNIIRSPSTTDINDTRRNILRKSANRWRQPGDETDIPEILVRDGLITPYDIGKIAYNEYFFSSDMEKGDFLKLTYINFSYNLPRNFIKKLGMEQCRFSINANNVFTWTKYKGIDPENNGVFGYPSARKYTASLEITF